MNNFNLQRFSLIAVLLLSLFVCVNYLNAQTSYLWIGGSSGVFTNAANSSPSRTTTATNDILLFSSDATVTGVTTQTIGQLVLSGKAMATLQTTTKLSTIHHLLNLSDGSSFQLIKQ